MITKEKENFVRQYADTVWRECVRTIDDEEMCEQAFEDIFSMAVRAGIDRETGRREKLLELTKVYVESAYRRELIRG